MKILDTNQFVSEKMKVKPVTNAQLDAAKKYTVDIDTLKPIDKIFKNWGPDDFVSWDEVQYFVCHSHEFVDRNIEKCNKEGVPEDCRCSICQKELKHGYKTLYWKAPTQEEIDADGRGSSSRWYAVPAKDREPAKVGNTCMKAFTQAHKKIYGR